MGAVGYDQRSKRYRFDRVSGGALNNPTELMVFTASVNVTDFTGIISLLENQGECSFKPAYCNGQQPEGRDKGGTDEFFVTNVATTTTTGTSTTNTKRHTDFLLRIAWM